MEDEGLLLGGIALATALLLGLMGAAIVQGLWVTGRRGRQAYLRATETRLAHLFVFIGPRPVLYASAGLSLSGAALGWVLFRHPIPAAVAGGLCWTLPSRILSHLERRRRQQLEEQLVPALNTLSSALRAGFSLPQGLERLSQEMGPPLCQEFGLVLNEHRLGISLEQALEHLRARLQNEAMDLVVGAVLLAYGTGGNLSEVLTQIARLLRERTRIKRKIRSLVAQGRLQGTVVSLLPATFGLALHLLDPGLLAPVFRDPLGLLCLAAAALFQAAGWLLIRRITSIEV
ncbi:MAG: type II secretion system F family protein [Deltaproteobacteria bacterium]|nr:type II secretion system F family protein [Deltaproteobacteria bacterium]MBI3075388.1 type II secretion system F family protein [Deltaproteobacteria bacterium]